VASDRDGQAVRCGVAGWARRRSPGGSGSPIGGRPTPLWPAASDEATTRALALPDMDERLRDLQRPIFVWLEQPSACTENPGASAYFAVMDTYFGYRAVLPVTRPVRAPVALRSVILPARTAAAATPALSGAAPHVLRDVQGRPISPQQARELIDEQFIVPSRRSLPTTVRQTGRNGHSTVLSAQGILSGEHQAHRSHGQPHHCHQQGILNRPGGAWRNSCTARSCALTAAMRCPVTIPLICTSAIVGLATMV
jgi:hypothetical protein